MILCVAPSPAWDVTYGVERFTEHATNRAHTVSARAGGKAVNVARVLHALGEQVTVVAPVGGPTGELFAEDLAAWGVARAVDSALELRRTVTVVSDETGDATVVNEPGELEDWPAFLSARGAADGPGLRRGGGGIAALGAPLDAFGQLARAAARTGCRSSSTPVGPPSPPRSPIAVLVKPNLAELRDIGTPRPRRGGVPTLARVRRGGRGLVGRGRDGARRRGRGLARLHRPGPARQPDRRR